MEIQVDKRGGQVGPHQYEDAEGYVMPLSPASGRRRIPLGAFPTGPSLSGHCSRRTWNGPYIWSAVLKAGLASIRCT